MEVIALIILGGLAAFLVAIASVAKQSTAGRQSDRQSEIDELNAAQQARLATQHPRAKFFVSQYDHSIMVIDFERQKIILGLAETLTGIEKTYESIYDFSNIVGVEVRTDGNMISSTNRGSQALGAAVGAVAFGGVGAIIGGLSGSSTSQKQLKKLSIRVAVDDTERPSHEVTFFQLDAGLPIDDTLLQPCLKEADTFEAHIINAIRKSKTASSNGSNGRANSSASALRDLWALKQEGALTEEEFQNEKDKLFGSVVA